MELVPDAVRCIGEQSYHHINEKNNSHDQEHQVEKISQDGRRTTLLEGFEWS